MSAFDEIDRTFNTTSIPTTGIFAPTTDQFFCELTKLDVRCLSSAQFVAQPFDQLCPSGDCWTDCQDLKRLYSPLPSGITFANQTAYGNPPNVTLWPLCASLTNISLSIAEEVAPAAEIAKVELFFKNTTLGNLRGVAAAATQCWTDTCARARDPKFCEAPCAAVNLLQSRVVPQLAGTRECIKTLCTNIEGLPFANQDVVGPGVTSSYVIQSVLIVISWIALAAFDFMAWRRRRRSPEPRPSKSRNSLLESISGFHAAQCYFSIPLAVAALITDPFSLDPLNAIGLLPVSINGFLPQIFTLMVLHQYGLQSWYPLVLTAISYCLNTIIFWAVVVYLHGIKAKGTGLESSAFESLGDVASCGDLTAIGICLQFQQDSPPAFLIQKYGETAWIGIRLAPAVWAWCTILLLLLIILQRRSRMAGKALSKRSPKAWQGSYLVVPDRVRHILGGALAYYVLSGIFFVGLIYQAVMFYSYVSLGLVDLATWSFGQIVAITVWVPPVVDYLHLQLSETSADSQSLAETLIITIEVIMTKRRARGTRAGSPAASQELLATTGTSSWAATEQGYAPAAGHDDGAWQASPGIDAGPGDADTFGSAARPNEFPLEPREGRGS